MRSFYEKSRTLNSVCGLLVDTTRRPDYPSGMTQDKVKVLLGLSLFFIAWGSYYISKSIYTSMAWNSTQGRIVDFVPHTFSCGKGVSKCFTLLIGYHVNQQYYTIESDKSFTRNAPKHLAGDEVTVYYPDDQPFAGIAGGEYGPGSGGQLLLLFGIVLFIVWIFARKQ